MKKTKMIQSSNKLAINNNLGKSPVEVYWPHILNKKGRMSEFNRLANKYIMEG